MIFTERTITIRNDSSSINAPVILYRGDKNVEVRFTLVESPYKYSNRDSINIIESTDASYAQLVIKTPNGRDPIFGDITAVGQSNVIFMIGYDMIDEIEEVGTYDFQIRLFDANQTSMATIPEVTGGFIIKEPIAKEDTTNNITNSAIVGSAVVTSDVSIPTFVGGSYNKTAWDNGTVISRQKLDKIEDGIYETYELSKDNSSQIKDIENDYAKKEDIGAPSQDQVNAWLNNHPEATTTVQDRSIDPAKTTFFKKISGRNLLNPANIDFGTWLGNSTSGTTATKDPITNSAWNSFKAIEVEPNTEYIFVVNNAYLSGSNSLYSYWYDDAGNAISVFSFSGVVTSPSNAKYVRASFKSATTGTFGVYEGNKIPIYEEYVEPRYLFDSNYLEKEEEEVKKTKNLFNPNDVTYDAFLSSGNVSGNSYGWKVSGLIEVEPNTQYYLSKKYSSHPLQYSYYYDENKTMISQITGGNPFTTPENCKYVRFSIQNEIDYIQLEKGAEIGYYIPYGKEEDYRELLDSPLLGKKYCPIGDSITASGWGYELARQTGMVINNYNAIGGTTVCGAYDGESNMCGTTRIEATPSDTEIITIMGGSNDWSQQSQGDGIPVGDLDDCTIGSTDTLSNITFAGCYQLMLNRLYAQCPNAQVFILEQTYRYLEETDRTVPLETFREMTRKIAYKYGYPIIYTYQKSGINEMNYQDFYSDVIHPYKALGQKRLIEVIKSGLLSVIR